jgi:hypothetical protein
MPRSSPDFAWLVVMVSFCVFACEAKAVAEVPQPARAALEANHQPSLPAAGEQEDKFEITSWLLNPSPAQGDIVTLVGMLAKNGLYLNAVVLEASWPGEAQERNEPSCTSPVIYQRGICYIDTANFTSGESVLVTLKFRYNDKVIAGETSFTIK